MKFRKCFLTIFTCGLLVEEHHSRLCPEDSIDKLRTPRGSNQFLTENYYPECYPRDTVRYEPTTANEIVVKKTEKTKKGEIQKTAGAYYTNLFL